jgi:hypothetical protein
MKTCLIQNTFHFDTYCLHIWLGCCYNIHHQSVIDHQGVIVVLVVVQWDSSSLINDKGLCLLFVCLLMLTAVVRTELELI